MSCLRRQSELNSCSYAKEEMNQNDVVIDERQELTSVSYQTKTVIISYTKGATNQNDLVSMII